ncbi:P-loop containing nucleoside triphosphate hydrolase protein [Pilobolus umbonatus]|nr:P-loop containing nucleoside triphosphate hydrolase protein [Pilobolus umbonatus]
MSWNPNAFDFSKGPVTADQVFGDNNIFSSNSQPPQQPPQQQQQQQQPPKLTFQQPPEQQPPTLNFQQPAPQPFISFGPPKQQQQQNPPSQTFIKFVPDQNQQQSPPQHQSQQQKQPSQSFISFVPAQNQQQQPSQTFSSFQNLQQHTPPPQQHTPPAQQQASPPKQATPPQPKPDDLASGMFSISLAEPTPAPTQEVINVNLHNSNGSTQIQDSLVGGTIQLKLADSRGDPNSPLYSVKSFDELGLKESLLKGLYSMSFSKPSKIQERALPLMLSNPPKNMIGQSQSGTGKSAAFVLTMLQRTDSALKHPQAICLAPSRELARQIHENVKTMSKFTDITTALIVKDSAIKYRNVTANIVIGTPGSIADSIRRRYIDTSDIRVFVLDEADNMLDQDGLGDQSIRIRSLLKSDPQILLFSATFPEHVRTFAYKFAPDSNEISLKQEELSVDAIKQYYMDCSTEQDKYEVLCRLYDLLTVSQSIIFCKRRETAFEIAKRMTEQGHAVVCLHGGMASDERDKVMDDFRRGEFKVLVTTNVLSRGIDILQVTLVINYDMPLDSRGDPDPEVYLHRIGRTGRFGRIGVSINFVHDKTSWEQMRFMEDYFNKSIERVPTEDWEEAERILKPVL